MFSHLEQIAIREWITERDSLRARIAALEEGTAKVVTSNLPLERFEALEKEVAALKDRKRAGR